jgi:hypothetical protein
LLGLVLKEWKKFEHSVVGDKRLLRRVRGKDSSVLGQVF